MAQAPWYLDNGKSGLGHQRLQIDNNKSLLKIGEVVKKGLKKGPVAKKWRKGACENCGAMTHRRKDCLERPRQKGAKLTNKQIMPDEYIVSHKDSSWDGK